MSPVDWRRAQSVFDQVVDAPSAIRERLIAEQCGADADLADAVRDLIDQDSCSDALIDRAPITVLRRTVDDERGRHWIGRSLGAYKILDKIGQGGMGQVFLAERGDQAFSKRVAIKILSIAHGSALDRFHRERQILADLEHPGIARLLDGGTTPDGLPFVVIELVEGSTFIQHCDTARLSLRERIRLFLSVCPAVEFAHRNLVVHRDLKPSNILVTPEGETKLLDFGIAKLLSPSEADQEATLAPDRALTLDYASPEQIAGGPVTTATDVYSLGVVLYRTLTGRLPADRAEMSPATAERDAESNDPLAPSVSVVRAKRESADFAPRVPAHALRGDLDNILLKALQRRPAQRYLSVEALARDLENYLAGLPIAARSPGLGYRTSKFVRRHAIAVSMAVLSALVLLGFSVAMFVQSRKLEVERDVSRQALAFMVETFEDADPAVNLGREPTARDILKRGTERLEAAQGPPSEVDRVLMHTVGRIHSSLGSYPEAREWLERSLAAGESLDGPDSPSNGPVLRDLGEVLLAMAEYRAAEDVARRALASRLDDQPALGVQTRHILAESRAAQGKLQESADLHGDALELARRRLAESDPQLVTSLSARGRALRRLGDLNQAAELASETLRLQLLYRPGDSPDTARLLAASGVLELRLGNLPRAREDSLEALEMRLRIYGESHDSVARSLMTLGRIAGREGQLEKAEELLRRSLETFGSVLGEDNPQTVGARFEYAGLLLEQMNAPERAAPVYREAIASYEKVEGSERSSQLASLLAGLGQALNDLERYPEAQSHWRRSLSIRVLRDEAGSDREIAARIGLAEALLGQARYGDAERELTKAWNSLVESAEPSDERLQETGATLVGILERSGRHEAARAVNQRLSGIQESSGN